jgi:hypothetical protein
MVPNAVRHFPLTSLSATDSTSGTVTFGTTDQKRGQERMAFPQF